MNLKEITSRFNKERLKFEDHQTSFFNSKEIPSLIKRIPIPTRYVLTTPSQSFSLFLSI